jgi:hypothetical protein
VEGPPRQRLVRLSGERNILSTGRADSQRAISQHRTWMCREIEPEVASPLLTRRALLRQTSSTGCATEAPASRIGLLFRPVNFGAASVHSIVRNDRFCVGANSCNMRR